MEVEMIADGLLVACGAFGFSAFCFVAGYIAGCSRLKGSATFPLSHVSFDPELPDEARLRFLARAADAVRSGALSQAQQLKDESSGD